MVFQEFKLFLGRFIGVFQEVSMVFQAVFRGVNREFRGLRSVSGVFTKDLGDPGGFRESQGCSSSSL